MESVVFWVVIAAMIIHAMVSFAFKLLDWRWTKANAHKVPDNLKESVSPEDHAKSAAYTLDHLRLGFARRGFDLALRIGVLACGVLPWVYGIALNSWGEFNYWGQSFALSIIGIFFGFFYWPFSLISTFKIEEKYGFNRSTFTTWINDQFKGIVLGMVLGIPLTAAVLWMAGTFTTWWWLYAFLIVSAYTLFVSWIYPNLIAPMFNKFTQLEEGSLRDRLHALADQAGMKFEKIFVMDASRRTAHANAYFTGVGSSRRVVLFDTLINQLSDDEIAAVLAHEIGHMKKHHVLKHMILSRVVEFLNFFILSLLVSWGVFVQAFGFDASMGLAAVILVLSFFSGAFSFWMTPIMSAWYRKHEYEADAIAADMVGDAMPLVSALRKMTKESLHSIDNHPATRAFYASHPSLEQREKALGIVTKKSE